MDPYRIYQLDRAGNIVGPPKDIEYPNDLEVLKAAEETLKVGECVVEVWQGTRLVG
jgi:hypothetical protein